MLCLVLPSLSGELLDSNALALVLSLVALRSPCAKLVALQSEPHSHGCWGMGRGAMLEEGALVLGLPPGSQPPAWEREGGETGQREVRPSGAAQDPVAENGAIREPSGRRNRLEPVGPSEDGVGLRGRQGLWRR